MDTYKTLKSKGFDEYITKKSKFIGYAAPVKSDEEAIKFINEIKKKHSDATHNVYAYAVREGQIKRYSDDGEPQSTAGIPVLNVILGNDVVDCVVVVTRYFGGTLLGTGGLVRAYSQAAKLALAKAGIGVMSLFIVLEIHCGYDFYGKLSSIISENKGKELESIFEKDVYVRLEVPAQYEGNIKNELTQASAGKLSFKNVSEKYGFI
ncbi:MAG TPA: YigZ family protein [Oscillospiraceae bacterium]|nr:YigZ family protein [Oscillospiraceae bacterium]